MEIFGSRELGSLAHTATDEKLPPSARLKQARAIFSGLGGRLDLRHTVRRHAITLENDLAQAAHLADPSPEQTRLALAVGLFAEDYLSLAQAALVARLDRQSFQRHLAGRGLAVPAGEYQPADMQAEALAPDKPWLALGGSARYVGDPFAPAVSEEEIAVLQKAEVGVTG